MYTLHLVVDPKKHYGDYKKLIRIRELHNYIVSFRHALSACPVTSQYKWTLIFRPSQRCAPVFQEPYRTAVLMDFLHQNFIIDIGKSGKGTGKTVTYQNK